MGGAGAVVGGASGIPADDAIVALGPAARDVGVVQGRGAVPPKQGDLVLLVGRIPAMARWFVLKHRHLSKPLMFNGIQRRWERSGCPFRAQLGRK